MLEQFAALSDPRQTVKVKILYPLPEIVLLLLCATLAGADDFVEVQLWRPSSGVSRTWPSCVGCRPSRTACRTTTRWADGRTIEGNEDNLAELTAQTFAEKAAPVLKALGIA